jgi:hypothetical protein
MGGEGRDGKRRETSDRECLRLDARGKVLDTRHRLTSREGSSASRKTRKAESREAAGDSRKVRTARKVKRAPTPSYSNNNWGWSQGWGWSSGWQHYGSWNRW